MAHTAIDAKWFLQQGTNREAAFKRVVEEAGQLGQVLVINMQGARGVDIPLTSEARAAGGMHVRVTARSGLSDDIDVQAENRAARSGDPGSVSYYISADDDAFALSHNPAVRQAVIQYTEASNAHTGGATAEEATAADVSAREVSAQDAAAAAPTGEALTRAEQALRSAVRIVQADAARRQSKRVSDQLSSAPSAATAGTAVDTSPSAPDQPPPGPAVTPRSGRPGARAGADAPPRPAAARRASPQPGRRPPTSPAPVAGSPPAAGVSLRHLRHLRPGVSGGCDGCGPPGRG